MNIGFSIRMDTLGLCACLFIVTAALILGRVAYDVVSSYCRRQGWLTD